MADTFVDVDVAGISRGLLQGGSGNLSRLIGRPTTPLADTVAAALKGSSSPSARRPRRS